jgi:hypothetical protein
MIEQRIDVHRPSVINPADYEFVGFEHIKSEGYDDIEAILANREQINRHMECTGGTYSRHQHGGNCHICGSVNALYTVLFYHKPTNSYVRTGTDCGEKLGCGDAEDFKKNVKAGIESIAGKKKAQALLEAMGIFATWNIYLTVKDNYNSFTGGSEEHKIFEMIYNLVKYGSFVSIKQQKYLTILLDRVVRREEIAAQRARDAELAAPVPVSDGRQVIVGKILSIKKPAPYIEEGWAAYQLKALILVEEGFKLYGNLPKSLWSSKVGDKVEFSAKVKQSEKDTKFGFFSRPTKAKITQEAMT